MKKLTIIILGLSFFFAGCGVIKSSGVSSNDPRIPFSHFYRGFISLVELSDNDFSLRANTRYILTDDEQWNTFKEKYLPDVTGFPSIDFENESLYVIPKRGGVEFARSYEIKELAYNEKTFVVIMSQENSTTMDNDPGKIVFWLSILKVKKADLPEGGRDWLMIPERPSQNKD